ncbi:beta-1,4-glucuronyltransferase 1 [Venturia canescens]|uniref:beta-1,4-glucuronyltransferase 1 n=1 Tax=Venturia canescens TaxID=32260 RepID=UPI001C9CF690|nr:beta-1,4-glucuronyltransferase 1 [Venturia canescens]
MNFIARRNWALRLSIVLNICVVLYVCAHLTSSGPWMEETPSNWGGSNVPVPLAETYGSPENLQINSSQRTKGTSLTNLKQKTTKNTSEATDKRKQNTDKLTKLDISTASENKKKEHSGAGDAGADDRRNESTTKKSASQDLKKNSKTVVGSKALTKEAIRCNEKSSEPRTAQRGDYWVLYNYVPMSMNVRCWESVTYATHGDYTFLDNLEPLLERWRAPISIALYAPGTDFQPTLNSIKYVRSCSGPLVSQLVTFHIYFSSKHVPKVVPRSEKILSENYNCSLAPPWSKVSPASMYRNEKKLLYPVNVGRNIARECAPTHYLIVSDIELYPSPNLSSTFLEMITKYDQPVLLKPNPKVFVLSIFEVDEKSTPPSNKTALIAMLKNGTAIPFHKKLCAACHNVPKSKEWQETPQSSSLRVFHVGKRTGKFVHWEPIFIGTNNDPMYDERLSWEGKSDKMTQGYALCVLDYDFLILDNAFLVHRPGIKIYKKDPRRDSLTAKTNMLIKKIIVPELKVIYGTRKDCAV